jgi:hypothetical protein
MAVVVIKWFFRSKKTAKERLSYIAGRPGKEKEDMSRPLFGFGGQMSREQAERMIANAPKGTIFFPIILSPDPTRENTEKDLDLWHVTRQTFVALERRLHLAPCCYPRSAVAAARAGCRPGPCPCPHAQEAKIPGSHTETRC